RRRLLCRHHGDRPAGRHRVSADGGGQCRPGGAERGVAGRAGRRAQARRGGGGGGPRGGQRNGGGGKARGAAVPPEAPAALSAARSWHREPPAARFPGTAGAPRWNPQPRLFALALAAARLATFVAADLAAAALRTDARAFATARTAAALSAPSFRSVTRFVVT